MDSARAGADLKCGNVEPPPLSILLGLIVAG
jgi:hypothetical protein